MFANIIDIGTGTGLLAFAARHLWPDARIVATDIDPAAIHVTRENMAANAVDGHRSDRRRRRARRPRSPQARRTTSSSPTCSPGRWCRWRPSSPRSPRRTRRSCSRACWRRSARQVVDAYAACGCTLTDAEVRGDWTILTLRPALSATSRPNRSTPRAATAGRSISRPSRARILRAARHHVVARHDLRHRNIGLRLQRRHRAARSRFRRSRGAVRRSSG